MQASLTDMNSSSVEYRPNNTITGLNVANGESKQMGPNPSHFQIRQSEIQQSNRGVAIDRQFGSTTSNSAGGSSNNSSAFTIISASSNPATRNHNVCAQQPPAQPQLKQIPAQTQFIQPPAQTQYKQTPAQPQFKQPPVQPQFKQAPASSTIKTEILQQNHSNSNAPNFGKTSTNQAMLGINRTHAAMPAHSNNYVPVNISTKQHYTNISPSDGQYHATVSERKRGLYQESKNDEVPYEIDDLSSSQFYFDPSDLNDCHNSKRPRQ